MGKACYPCIEGECFLLLLFLHFHSFSSFSPVPLSSPLLSLLSLFSVSLGDNTKLPTLVDVSLNPNTIKQSQYNWDSYDIRICKHVNTLYHTIIHLNTMLNSRKGHYGMCEQWRPKLNCASRQSDQHLCSSKYSTSHSDSVSQWALDVYTTSH